LFIDFVYKYVYKWVLPDKLIKRHKSGTAHS